MGDICTKQWSRVWSSSQAKMVVTDVTLFSLALVNVGTANQPLSVIENKPTAKIRSEIGQAPGPNLIN